MRLNSFFLQSLKNISFTTILQISAVITGLFNVVILLNTYSIREYGVYTFAFSINSLIYYVSIPGLKEVMFIDVAENYEGSYLQSIRLRFVASLLSTCLFILFTIIFYQNDTLVFLSLISLALIFPLNSTASLSASFIFSKRKFSLATSVQVIKQIGITTGYFIIAYFQQPIYIIIIFHGILIVVIDSCILVSSFSIIDNSLRKGNLLNRGIKYSVASFLESMDSYIDRILAVLFSFEFVALINLIQLAYSQGKSFSLMLSNFILPDYIKNYSQLSINSYDSLKILRYSFLFLLFGCFGVALIIPVFYSGFLTLNNAIITFPAQLMVLFLPLSVFKDFYKGIAIKENKINQYYIMNVFLVSSKVISIFLSAFLDNLLIFAVFVGLSESLMGIFCLKRIILKKASIN